MHRIVPWLLLALVAVGGAAGAALGIADKSAPQTPAQWVAAVLATTEQQGTARFSFTQITSSPSPDLRGSLSGSGVVNFAKGDARVTEVDRTITFTSSNSQPLHPVHSTNTLKAIVIGGTVYQANPIPGISFTSRYRVLPFPKLPRSQQGLSLALNAAVALDGLRGPNAVASVRPLGPAEVDGVTTTQYEVTYAPFSVCAPHKAPVVVRQLPTRVWVDSAGRLVQVRGLSYFSDRPPKGVKIPASLAALPMGPITTVATLRFSAFGAPVHVVAPPASAIVPSGHSISATLSESPRCHS
jgi:hypothetical protein